MSAVNALRAAVTDGVKWRDAARAMLGRDDVDAAEMRKHLDIAEVHTGGEGHILCLPVRADWPARERVSRMGIGHVMMDM